MRDSARERKKLDPHAEMIIRWLCPHSRARRGNVSIPADIDPRAGEYSEGWRGRWHDVFDDDVGWFHKDDRRDEPQTLSLMSQGCNRARNKWPLYGDDTAQDVGNGVQ